MKTAAPDKLLERASWLIGQGRTGAARPVLAAVREMIPPQPRLAELVTLMDMQDGNLEAVRHSLDRDISTWPEYTGLRRLRAELRLRMSDLSGALADAADCVIQAPEDPVAKALLGMMLLEAGQAQDAMTCLREAVGAIPAHPGFVQALAAAQEAVGDLAAASTTLGAGIAAIPGNSALRNAAVLLAVRQRDFLHAVGLAEAARREGVADACLFGLMGHALSSLGRHDEAADSYREALKLGPGDPYIRHLVAASGVIASATRAPDEYVRTVFNGYAERFEEHLISLGYRVPGLVRAALLRHRPGVRSGQMIAPVLDLGCGTGLLAVVMSDLPLSDFVGVDLSASMIAQARKKDLYTEFHVEEIGGYLAEETRQFPLIMAADVFCYFGDLVPVLSALTSRLPPDGICILTVEELQPGDDSRPWTLGRQGRYAHSQDYIRICAASVGLQVRELSRDTLRREAGAAIPGLLVVLGHGL